MYPFGNWCGPGWSAGQFKDSKDLTDEDKQVPAVNALDQCCKDHDIELSEATTDEQVKAANDKFLENANKQGHMGQLMGIAVAVGGPKTVADVQGTNTRLRGSENKRKAEEDLDSPEKIHKNDPKRKADEMDTPTMITPGAMVAYDEGISAKNKRTRPQREIREGPTIPQIGTSLSNLQDSTQVEKTMEATTESRALTTTGAGGTSGGLSEKETPVLPLYNSLPFRDVTQTRFKNQYFFSVNNLQWTSGTQDMALNTANRVLKIRMNDFRESWKASLSQQTAAALVSTGISTNAMVGRYDIQLNGTWKNPTDLVPFPETNLTPQTYLPQMSKYYTNLYNAMTIVGCTWRLHIDFPNPELPIVAGTTNAFEMQPFSLKSVQPQVVTTNSEYVTEDIAAKAVNLTSGFTQTFKADTRYPNQSIQGTTPFSPNAPYPSTGPTASETYKKYAEATGDIGGNVLYSGYKHRPNTSTTPGSTALISNNLTDPVGGSGGELDYRPKYSPRPAGARISMHYETKAAQGEGIVTGALESNMPVPCHIMDMERWPAIVERHTIYNADRGRNGNSHHVFSGSWKPNWQNHNPLNDDQIKTWIPTSGASKNFEENLIIQFYRSWDTPKNPLEIIGLNCWLEVDYDVQFRGLKEAAMWPLQNRIYTYKPGAQPDVELTMPQASYYTQDGTFPALARNP